MKNKLQPLPGNLSFIVHRTTPRFVILGLCGRGDLSFVAHRPERSASPQPLWPGRFVIRCAPVGNTSASVAGAICHSLCTIPNGRRRLDLCVPRVLCCTALRGSARMLYSAAMKGRRECCACAAVNGMARMLYNASPKGRRGCCAAPP